MPILGRPCALLISLTLAWGAPLCLNAQASNADAPPSNAAPAKSVALDPIVITSKPIGSFGLSVKAMKDGISTRIMELTILDVIPHTDADKEGLGPLTQILSIDGRSVREFTASFDHGSDLSAKLIDRKRGDRITLEVLILGAKKSRQVTLTEGHGVHQFPNQTDSEIEPLRTLHIGISH